MADRLLQEGLQRVHHISGRIGSLPAAAVAAVAAAAAAALVGPPLLNEVEGVSFSVFPIKEQPAILPSNRNHLNPFILNATPSTL